MDAEKRDLKERLAISERVRAAFSKECDALRAENERLRESLSEQRVVAQNLDNLLDLASGALGSPCSAGCDHSGDACGVVRALAADTAEEPTDE